ncbi:hypothetical protein EDC36_1156 [Tepidimonas ignava]|uniref:Uncharacterized protein n=1 Tax=Tepidimonas ignava TaxID=114249 RepID=A0A4R3L6N0_9BURK|nr:hypothetical protein [Tepidimonas ignava]TCS95259.1 hypothetical protein EDC36_1156 [Tepidimonas ignava]TSE19802.1 hypothetical protein Tigna_02131 [Tepidimonas ignava]
MGIDVLVQDRLHGNPAARATKAVKPCATAQMIVTDTGGEQHLAGLMRFDGDAMRQLLTLADGD